MVLKGKYKYMSSVAHTFTKSVISRRKYLLPVKDDLYQQTYATLLKIDKARKLDWSMPRSALKLLWCYRPKMWAQCAKFVVGPAVDVLHEGDVPATIEEDSQYFSAVINERIQRVLTYGSEGDQALARGMLRVHQGDVRPVDLAKDLGITMAAYNQRTCRLKKAMRRDLVDVYEYPTDSDRQTEKA